LEATASPPSSDAKVNAAAAPQTAAVDDKLRKKLLGNLYICTSAADLLKMFLQALPPPFFYISFPKEK
jgi:hypothetical protein